MRHFASSTRVAFAAASVAGLVMITGCSDERTAEADTPVSEAEVSTDLPESVVSDQQLQATANAAADIAATPPAEVVPVPVPAGNTAATRDGSATATTNNAVTGNTTGR